MKFHHAVALALVGWYLMVPPLVSDPKRPQAVIDGTAPLSDWVVQEVFDTAKECRAARDAGREEFKRSNWYADHERLTPLDSASLMQKERADCIASDDPRL